MNPDDMTSEDDAKEAALWAIATWLWNRDARGNDLRDASPQDADEYCQRAEIFARGGFAELAKTGRDKP